MKQLLSIIFISISFFATGQDKLSIYFEFGSSKIQDKQANILNAIPANYDLSDADSIVYIGMADSTGNFDSNLKLSEKRARKVAKYCKKIIPETIPYKVKAIGETNATDDAKSRRVEIVFYYQSSSATIVDSEIEDGGIQNNKPCFNIDYRLLHKSQVRTITKKEKQQVLIETSLSSIENKRQHYYGEINSQGEFVSKQVRWKARNSGKSWWKERRYIATIPKESYDNYRLFKTDDEPCDTCSENLIEQKKITKKTECRQVDYFVMQNMQYKRILFNKKHINIRVPREYVDTSAAYYIGCGDSTKLVWKTKKGWGRKKYYYAKLTIDYMHNRVYNITKYTECCETKPEPSECDMIIMECAYIGYQAPYTGGLTFTFEIADNYQQPEHLTYGGIRIKKENSIGSSAYSVDGYSLLAGLDINKQFYGSLKYQVSITAFDYEVINPFTSWQKPASQPAFQPKYGRMYVGTELKKGFIDNHFLEQSAFVGLEAINVRTDAIIPRVFFQVGVGYDYLQNNTTDVYPLLQFGVNINLGKIDL